MNIKNSLLLSIVELGAFPDASSLYRQCGYEVHTSTSMRLALKFLKGHCPRVIACEFIYLPTYSMRISNLEPLLAAMDLYRCPAGLVIQVQEEQRPRLARLDLGQRPHYLWAGQGDDAGLRAALQGWRREVDAQT